MGEEEGVGEMKRRSGWRNALHLILYGKCTAFNFISAILFLIFLV